MFKKIKYFFSTYENAPIVVCLAIIMLIIVVMVGHIFLSTHGHYILWKAGYARDIEIVDANNELWQGKAEHFRSRVTDLVRVSRELKIFDESILPIVIRQEKLGGALAKTYIDLSIIAIEPVFFVGNAVSIYDENDIDGLLGHEFAHFLTRGIGGDHGKIWQETCRKLVEKLNDHSRSYDWCFPRAPIS